MKHTQIISIISFLNSKGNDDKVPSPEVKPRVHGGSDSSTYSTCPAVQYRYLPSIRKMCPAAQHTRRWGLAAQRGDKCSSTVLGGMRDMIWDLWSNAASSDEIYSSKRYKNCTLWKIIFHHFLKKISRYQMLCEFRRAIVCWNNRSSKLETVSLRGHECCPMLCKWSPSNNLGWPPKKILASLLVIDSWSLTDRHVSAEWPIWADAGRYSENSVDPKADGGAALEPTVLHLFTTPDVLNQCTFAAEHLFWLCRRN